METQFTKYETARIIGARALQIAMDAPLLLKVSESDLKAMKYDALKIAERELKEGVLPISIHRPVPTKKKEKLTPLKEDKLTDEDVEAKEREVEKEIAQDASELGLVEGDELEDFQDEPVSSAGTEEQ